MKILYAILAICCVAIVCYCYEENQKQHSDTITTLIGILGSFAFIASIAFITFALK